MLLAIIFFFQIRMIFGYQIKKKNVLLIDLDSQKSLTGTFETKDFNFKDKHNISEILSNPQIGIIATTVEKNIDVIIFYI